MKDIYKKWWFWVIVVVLLGLIIGGQNKRNSQNSPYINKYEWSLNDVKTTEMVYDNGDIENVSYVVLGVENKDKDLQAGEYTIKTAGDSNATFIIYVTDTYYEDAKDLPEPYTDMVQGYNNSTAEIKANKGQYIYLVKGSTGSDNGKVILEKK